MLTIQQVITLTEYLRSFSQITKTAIGLEVNLGITSAPVVW